jgi:hypothetical protein
MVCNTQTDWSQWLRLTLSKGPNRVGTEPDPVSEMYLLVFRLTASVV